MYRAFKFSKFKTTKNTILWYLLEINKAVIYHTPTMGQVPYGHWLIYCVHLSQEEIRTSLFKGKKLRHQDAW